MVKVTLDAETFKALASATRLTVLRALDERRKTLTELAKDLDLNKATVHEHLALLMTAGLVKKCDDEGRKWIYYELTWRGEKILHPQETTTFNVLLGLGVAAAGGGMAMLGRSLGWWLEGRKMEAAATDAAASQDTDPTALLAGTDGVDDVEAQFTSLAADDASDAAGEGAGGADGSPPTDGAEPQSGETQDKPEPASDEAAGDGTAAPEGAPDDQRTDAQDADAAPGSNFTVEEAGDDALRHYALADSDSLEAGSDGAGAESAAKDGAGADGWGPFGFDDDGIVALALMACAALFTLLAWLVRRKLRPTQGPAEGP